jgi:biopolymer transport protein ExbB/TolQ
VAFFPEQIRTSFVYHLMKLLILGVVAIVMVAVASGAGCFRDSDGVARWRYEVRESAREARDQAREARQVAREQALEFRDVQREALRAQREAIREQRERIREQVRQIRENMRDWRYTY